MEQCMAFKYRLYPNKEQAKQIDATLGCCRYIYNEMLSRNRKIYKRRGEHLNYNKMQNLLPGMKNYLPWLKEADSQALKYACRQLDTAYQRFFKKQGGFPSYKSKRNHNDSYTTTNAATIHVADAHIKLPLLGWVKYANSRPVQGKVVSATIRKTPTGKYFVSVCCKVDIQPLPVTDSVIGLDVGIKSFASDSNGNYQPNPKTLQKAMKKLKREQRRLSRKQKGSKNREKQRQRLAKQHEKVVNQRTDFLHKYSTALVKENQIICVEDLNIKGMVRNHKLAQCIADASWGEFYRQLEYKAAWNGRTLIRVPTFYPSSQTCSSCGYKNPEVKNLAVRNWVCPICGAVHDRDKNAADNILMKGLSMLPAAV